MGIERRKRDGMMICRCMIYEQVEHMIPKMI